MLTWTTYKIQQIQMSQCFSFFLFLILFRFLCSKFFLWIFHRMNINEISGQANWWRVSYDLGPTPSSSVENPPNGEFQFINYWIVLYYRKFTSAHIQGIFNPLVFSYFISFQIQRFFSGLTWLCLVEELWRGGTATDGATLSIF